MNVLEVSARWGEPRRALDDVDAALAHAPRGELCLLPELALTGYVSPEGRFDPSTFAETIEGETAAALRALARAHGTTIVGPLVLREEGELFNATVGFGPDGAHVFTYRKRHPWFPETWATAGSAPPPVVTVAGVATTICICFDLQFAPEDMVRELEAASLLLFPSAWVDEEDTRVPLLRELARRTGTWVAAANWAPGVVRVPGQGGSCVVDPRGEVVATARPGAGVVVVSAVVGPQLSSVTPA